MKKLLSLIIPTYNCAEYIDETLALILSELPGNCELILVDDGSTDSTPDILKKYAGRAAPGVRKARCPDNWFTNETGKNICIGEIAKLYSRGVFDSKR